MVNSILLESTTSKWICWIILQQNVSFGQQESVFHEIGLCSIIFNKYLLCALWGLIEHPHLIPMTSYIFVINFEISSFDCSNFVLFQDFFGCSALDDFLCEFLDLLVSVFKPGGIWTEIIVCKSLWEVLPF